MMTGPARNGPHAWSAYESAGRLASAEYGGPATNGTTGPETPRVRISRHARALRGVSNRATLAWPRTPESPEATATTRCREMHPPRDRKRTHRIKFGAARPSPANTDSH